MKRALYLAFAVLLLSCAVVNARSPRVTGTVLDTSGAVTPGVDVKVSQGTALILEMQKTRGGAPPPGAPAPVGAPTTPAPSSVAPASVPQPPRGAPQAAGPVAGQRGASANLPSMDELPPEIIRLNDQLLGKIAAAPSLNPQQQSLIQKLYKDQVKSRGGSMQVLKLLTAAQRTALLSSPK